MITPKQIQDLADPLESVYIHMADALLVNIGKHITSPTWTHTAAWEIQKLSELGQLTQENAAIINAWIKQIPAEIRDTMEDTRAAALDKLEKELNKAAKDGYITPPIADSTVQILQDYAQQAADHLNLVNTTMLQSSVEQYQRAVMLTQQEVARLEAQRAATQTILNEAAGNVATGVETRTVALRRAIKQISDEGLTGFIDRAGRHWTPEAYVNMDIRTTVHNVAIQATKSRMQDFNAQVFQVSSHAGARPGCYPYQGKFYSWDNSSGSVELGNGSVVDYAPLNSTTYGQPAGLFGINCGHYPIPIIPGVTIPHGADNIQPKEENDKAYAESQEQRALERKIREAKRVVEMAGDTATPEDKARVRELQGQMREFIERTGRTRRYDREQIGGTPQTGRTPQPAPTPGNVASQATTPKIEPIKFANSDVSDIARANGVAYNEVTRQEKQRTETEIINVLGGGDRTTGSCASLGLAWCGQKAGLDVLDFRGGISQKTFSRNATLKELKKIPGIVWDEESGAYPITVGNKLLKRVKPGKEYYYGAGRHAAIVRINDAGKLQYLELQSSKNNGWQDFNGNPRYTLNTRFGAPSSNWGRTTAFMFEVDSVKESPELAMILGFINTNESEQQKGTGGTIK